MVKLILFFSLILIMFLYPVHKLKKTMFNDTGCFIGRKVMYEIRVNRISFLKSLIVVGNVNKSF